MVKKKIKLCLIGRSPTKINKSTSSFCICPRCRAKRCGQVILHHSKKNWHVLLFTLTVVVLFVIVMGPLGRLGSRAESQNFHPASCFGADGAEKAQGVSDGEVVLLNNSSLSLACGTFQKNEAVNDADSSENVFSMAQDQRKVKSARLNFALSQDALSAENAVPVDDSGVAPSEPVLEQENSSESLTSENVSEQPAQENAPSQDENPPISFFQKIFGINKAIAKDISSPDFTLKYSLDGKKWHKAGEIYVGDVAGSFDILLRFAYEIDNLQIALEPVLGLEPSDGFEISIDSFSLETVFEDALTEETLRSLNKAETNKEDIFESPRDSFKADENAEFIIKGTIIPLDISEEKPVTEAPILDQESLEKKKSEVAEQKILDEQNPVEESVGAFHETPEENVFSENADQEPVGVAPDPESEIPALIVEETPTAETPAEDVGQEPVEASALGGSPEPTENNPPAEPESIVDQVLSFLRGTTTYAEDLSPQVVTAYVTDPVGATNTITPVIDVVNGVTKVIVPKPGRSFRPGKYSLHVEIADGGGNLLVSDQDFVWGVLAINLDKTVYLPGETAYVQMGVLNDKGSTICDANLQLEITDPNDYTFTIRTADGSISYSDTCSKDNVTDSPDYHTYLTIGSIGIYQTKLTNLDNGYSIEDSFEVRDYVPITIERISATRINPFKANYKMVFEIRANEDFAGSFEEQVPSSFEIIDPAVNGDTPYTTITTLGDKKVISWDLSLNRNKKATITYTYDSPNISPQLYLAGPASAGSLFTETRSWQIASDAACSSNVNPSGNWNTGGSWSGCSGTGGVPASGDTITITDGDTITLDTASATVAGLTLCDTSCATDTALIHSGTNSLTVNGNVVVNGGSGSGDSVDWTIGGGSATVSGSISYNPQATNSLRYGQITLSTGTLNAYGGIAFENTANMMDNQMLAITDAGVVNLKGSITNQAVADIQPGTTSTFNYVDTSAQSIVFDATASTYANLGITNTAGATIAASVSAANVTGNITVGNDSGTAGILKSQTTLAIVGNAAKAFTVKNGATFQIDGTTATFPTGFGTFTFGATSTTTYNQTSNQNVAAVASPGYGNLKLTPAGTPTYTLQVTSSSFLVQGDLTIGTGSNAVVVTGTANDPNITIGGSVDIKASATLTSPDTGSLTTSVGGNWTNAGIFTHSSQTVKFTATSPDHTINRGSSVFYNVTFDGVGGEWSGVTSTLSIAGNLTMTNGTLNNTTGSVVTAVAGSVVCGATCGVINLTNASFLHMPQTNASFGTNVAVDTKWTFYDLQFRSYSAGYTPTITTSSIGTGTIEVTLSMSIGNSGGANVTLDAGNRTWVLSGTGTAFSINATYGVFNGTSSTFRYTGNGATNIVASTGYGNLEIYPGGAGVTHTFASGTFTIAGNLVLGGNSNAASTVIDAGTNSATINVTGDVTLCAATCSNDVTFTKSSNSLTLNGTANTKTITDNNTVKQDLGAIVVGNGATAKTINMGSSITLTSLNITAAATFSFNNGAYTLTITGTGTPLTKTGTFTAGSNGTTVYTGAGATNITATTYNHLNVYPGANSATHTLPSGTLAVSGNLNLGGNGAYTSTTVDAGANSTTINLTGNLTICAATCGAQMTFTKSSNALTMNGTAGTVTLTDNNTTKQDLGAVVIGNASVAKHIDLGSSIKATSINITSSATLDSNGSNTITLTGTSTPFTVGGAFTYSTGTVVFTGDADLTIPAVTYYNLTFSPTVASTGKAYTFGGALAINNALDINPDAGSALALTVNLGGALTGPPAITIRRQNSATSNLSTSGSNYGITAASIDIQAGGTLTGNASTTITSNGAVTIASGGALSSTSGTLDIKGNYTNSGTFTHNNGIVTISGSSQQTLDGTMTTTSAFKTLTITNASGSDPDSSPSVIFSAAATASTFNALTASTKIRFLAGATYTFTAFNVNGQSTDTRVQLRSSSSPTAWLLVASGSPVVYNTNPKDSDATGGSIITATDATNLDGGNTPGWSFVAGITSSIVDSGGNPVASPVYTLQEAPLGFECQSTTGHLGDTEQKIRVDNASATPTWNLTIAATNGNTSLWDTGSITFDFNSSTGSGCTNGQLSIDTSAGTLTPKGGCSNTGISKLGSTSFIQGSVDDITLLQSDGTAETGCYWDLTGADLTQKLPIEQSEGAYTIDMTLTATVY